MAAHMVGREKQRRAITENAELARAKATLRRLGRYAKKSLGQHFLVDDEALSAIVEAANITPEDTVIEVGPGLGVLTRRLAAKAGRLVAVELDDNLAEALAKEMAPLASVAIIKGDILKLSPSSIFGSQIPAAYKVVANLPYYITSAVLRHFLEASPQPETIVVTVQKEVAEAISAPPGKMSLLAVSAQFYGQPEVVYNIPPESFYPPPKIDSAVLRIKLFPTPAVAVDDIDAFFNLVRAGFSAPRKQLGGSLAKGLDTSKEEAQEFLAAAGIEARRRAGTLTLDEWAELYRVYQARELAG